ncbi:hypothetical protein SAMN04488513_10714 [Pseudozobellia thermophila]|uniref:LPXTG-motif cell wall anchor domain-containing protein n=1 Tax=Pseudozobellia thermophila TaxID=192903 RepID=A0A1M6L4A5_9FLAO|nr:hypothetical protein SAMN04488513_10714 [Pseudozobellia thermophila]
MSHKKKLALVLLFGIPSISKPVFAHTDINSDAGILSNVIAVGLVLASIIIFILVSRKKKENDT